MSGERHAEIAGGGLAGLNAAIALRTRGWSVRVHEQGPELRMFGAGIWLWENGLRVLRANGVEAAAIAGAPRITDWEVRDVDGATLMHRSFGPDDRLYIPVRAKVYDALVARARALDIEVVTSATAVAARPEGVLVLEDGSELQADLVVAADGHRSRVRESLGLTKAYRAKPEGCTRLLVRRDPDEDPPTTPIEHWSGHRRILTCPSGPEETYVCLALPTADERGRAVPVDKETWTESFPQMERLIERIGDSGRWDVLSYVTLKSWSAGRVAVIGDAAHAQPPNLGQGANLSFANGLALAATLEGAGDVPVALRAWEARERPLTDHTQRWTNLYGAVVEHWPDRLAGIRSQVIGRAAALPWVARQMNRAARSIPTGSAS